MLPKAAQQPYPRIERILYHNRERIFIFVIDIIPIRNIMNKILKGGSTYV